MKLKLVLGLFILASSKSLYCIEAANEKLRIAVEENNLALVQEAIKEGADPNYYENPEYARRGIHDPGQAPLFRSIAPNSNLEMAEFLIKSGAKLNIVGSMDTPFIRAIDIDNPERRKAFVDLLIKSGADVNLPSQNTTPLINATVYGFTDIVETLLEHGANPYGKNIRQAPEFPATPIKAAKKWLERTRNPEEIKKYQDIINLLETYMKKPKPKKPIIAKEPELKKDEETL